MNDYASLVQKTKQPERNLVADANFNVVRRDVGIRHVLYLRESLARSAYLEQMLSVHKKIALRRIGHVMSDPQLVEEESLASPFLPAE